MSKSTKKSTRKARKYKLHTLGICSGFRYGFTGSRKAVKKFYRDYNVKNGPTFQPQPGTVFSIESPVSGDVIYLIYMDLKRCKDYYIALNLLVHEIAPLKQGLTEYMGERPGEVGPEFESYVLQALFCDGVKELGFEKYLRNEFKPGN